MLAQRFPPDDGVSTTLGRVDSHPPSDAHPDRVTRWDSPTRSIDAWSTAERLRLNAHVMRIDLDVPVTCLDGAFGEVRDLVIESSSRRLTHVAIRRHDDHDNVRLVPTPGAQSDQDADRVSLDLTVAEISAFEPIQESAYLRPGELVAGGADWDVGIQEMFPLPEYGSLGPEMLGEGMAMEYDQHVAVSYHRVPKGSVEIRRASPVTSADGHHLGHVVGFVIDDQEQIEQLILEHGHLWGKRMVAIPSRAIERLESDAVTLSLTSDEVGALKSTPAHRWAS